MGTKASIVRSKAFPQTEKSFLLHQLPPHILCNETKSMMLPTAIMLGVLQKIQNIQEHHQLFSWSEFYVHKGKKEQ